MDTPLVELMTRLGRTFDDPSLLVQAVSHRSWCAEAGGHRSNERLEFLGDAVLGFVVADHCYRTYPESSEGDMAQVRSAVVNTNVLAEVAAELELGSAVRLGRGEEASGGRSKASILADSLEAVIGAVYLDGGREAAQSFVLRFLGTRISAAAAGPGAGDHKTRLQEFVVHLHGEAPRYEVVGSGPDHDRRFRADVYVIGSLVGHGSGRSKKDAEQAAARAAWKAFESSKTQATKTPATKTLATEKVRSNGEAGGGTKSKGSTETLVSDA